MGNMGFVDAAIESALKDLHCAYIGKVTWTDGVTAKVQPLGKIKEYGGTGARTQAIVSDVPVACRYKFTAKKISYTNSNGGISTQLIVEPKEIEPGNLVVCICGDRNIAAARKGRNELPPAGMHDISDSIIVGIL